MAGTENASKTRIDSPIALPKSDADLAGSLGKSTHTVYTKDKANIKVPRGADAAKIQPGENDKYSLFNDYHVLHLVKGNYPIFDTDYSSMKEEISAYSAVDLINTPRGASIFMPRDFMLCSRYGMPINRMITLRRFPYPVGDNIFEKVSGSELDTAGITEPDVGRMVTYMDQDTNKLSEILKFSYKLNWRTLNASAENQGGMEGDQSGVDGWMKSMAGLMDDGTIGRNEAQGKNRLAMNPLNDQNKVHGPVDSIAESTIRDIGMTNDFNFVVTFDYELKSINGMNPKALFLDLISNVLAVTFNNGRFWGGARIWVGERPSNWMRKLAFMNPKDAEDFMQKGRVAFKEAIKPFSGEGGAKAAIDLLKNIVMNGINLALGKILDKVGRPSTMVMNSLLTGESTGEWHLTIGNPLNPIMSVGNLILDNTEISFGDELGYDDFPTKLIVTCTLKQGMPRDKAGIESIFNRGMGRTYWSPESIMGIKTNYKNNTGGTYLGGQGNAQGTTFGAFDNASILRSAEMQTEYQRATPSDSFTLGVTNPERSLPTSTPPPPKEMKPVPPSSIVPKPETPKNISINR